MRFRKRDLGWMVFTTLLVVFAVVVNTVRLFALYWSIHPKTVEQWVSDRLHQTTHIGAVHLVLDGFSPVFIFDRVELLDPKTQAVRLQIHHLTIRLNVLQSLWKHQWILKQIDIAGVEIHLFQDAQHQWKMRQDNGVTAATNQNTSEFTALDLSADLNWLSQQPNIHAYSSTIFLQTLSGEQIILRHLQLAAVGEVGKEKIALSGTVKRSSVKEKRTPFFVLLHFFLENKGDTTQIRKITAYANVHNMPLSSLQWLPYKIPSVTGGILSSESWMTWESENHFFIQTHLSARQVVYQKNVLKRFSGDFLLRRNNTLHWNIVGKNIALEMPDNSKTKKDLPNPELHLFAAFNLDYLTRGIQSRLFFKSVHLYNKLFSIHTRAAIFLPQKKIKLLTHFSFKNLHALIPWLLPFGIPEEDLQWSNEAIKAGAVDDGNMLWDGNFQNFPYVHHDGVFTLRAKLNNATVKYLADWPEATGIDGAFEWHNGSFSLIQSHASIQGINLQAWSASVSDLTKPVLMLHIRTPVPLEKINTFLQHTDWENKASVQPLKATGTSQFQLDLQVPLVANTPPRATGQLQFSNASIAWSGLPDAFLLSGMNGNILFENADVHSEHPLQAQWLGQSIQLEVKTAHPKTGDVLQIAGTSHFISGKTLQNAWPATAKIFSGKTAYQVQLNIPYPKSIPNYITFDSNLHGLGISIPNSYQKLPAQTKPFHFALTLLDPNRLTWTMNYASQLQGAGNFIQQKNNWSITRVDLNLCGKPAVYPSQDGLSVCVHEPSLDVSTFFDQSSLPTFLPPLRTAEVMADQLSIASQNYPNVDLMVQLKGKQAWAINIKSPQATGNLQYSKNPDELTAHFQKLNIANNTKKTSKKGTILPSSLPAFAINVDELDWNGKSIGAAVLNTHPITGGLAVSQFQLRPATCQLDSSGTWQNAGQQLMHMNGLLHCNDFGKWLQNFTPKPVFLSGNGDVHFDLAWLAASDFPLQELSGSVNINAKNGAIIGLSEEQETELGLGKLLNAFSLQALGDRFKNGFKDLTTNGYSFNIFTGDFKILQGVATTDNLLLDGPVAKIKGTGSINLAKESYDLNLSVLPYVTSSIPVVAAFAGGPVVGAVAYLVNKAVSSKVSKSVEKQVVLQGNVSS